MGFKSHRLFAGLRRRYPPNVFGNPRSVPSYLRILEKRQWVKRPLKSAEDCSITKPKSWWPISQPRQHFGPKARIPDLFQRKDDVHLKLAAHQLEWYETPPRLHHDLLGAVAKVGRIEERINYTFKNKMMCVEALKVTSSVTPLFFKGMIHKIDRNNRLALLGDRVLRLVLCEIWFPTGNSLSDYMKMHTEVESRASLAEKGRALGMDKELLLPEGVDDPEAFQIAEAFEAVVGAIYLDSGKSVEVVKKVINDIKLDNHKFLKPNPRSRNAQNRKELWYHYAEGELLHEKTGFLEREALAFQKEIQDVDAPVAAQQTGKPTDDPQIQVAAKKKAKTLDQDATRLHIATEDANASVEGLRDNLATDSQMKVHIKRRIEYLKSSSLRKKENSITFGKSQQGDKPGVDFQTRENGKKNAVHDPQLVDSVLSGRSSCSGIPTTATEQQELPAPITQGQSSAKVAKEPSTKNPQTLSTREVRGKTSEPPECTSATIIDLVEDIKVFHRRRTSSSSWRARKRWAAEHQELLKEAWNGANRKAVNLRELRLPADTGALYEEILREKLKAVLEREQHGKREREAAYAMKQSLAPKDPQETPGNPEKPE